MRSLALLLVLALGASARDCVVSEWSAWSECSAAVGCGYSSRSRERNVIEWPEAGLCPDLYQLEECMPTYECAQCNTAQAGVASCYEEYSSCSRGTDADCRAAMANDLCSDMCGTNAVRTCECSGGVASIECEDDNGYVFDMSYDSVTTDYGELCECARELASCVAPHITRCADLTDAVGTSYDDMANAICAAATAPPTTPYDDDDYPPGAAPAYAPGDNYSFDQCSPEVNARATQCYSDATIAANRATEAAGNALPELCPVYSDFVDCIGDMKCPQVQELLLLVNSGCKMYGCGASCGNSKAFTLNSESFTDLYEELPDTQCANGHPDWLRIAISTSRTTDTAFKREIASLLGVAPGQTLNTETFNSVGAAKIYLFSLRSAGALCETYARIAALDEPARAAAGLQGAFLAERRAAARFRGEQGVLGADAPHAALAAGALAAAALAI